MNSEKNKLRFLIYAIGALLTGGLGFLLTLRPGEGLARLSYDLPFLFQTGGDSNVVMVYVNPTVKRNLNQNINVPLKRIFYAQLVERLHRDGARLIFFDLISFEEAGPDPTVDERFIRAARRHGRVVLVSASLSENQMNMANVEVMTPIAPGIAEAVAGIGLSNVDDKPDRVVRQMFMGTADDAAAGWVAARLLGAPVTRKETNRLRLRWLNYYGPPGSLRGVNLDHALAADGLPPGFFRDRIVVVGAGSDIALEGSAQDEFASPHYRLGMRVGNKPARLLYGAEVHAQTLLNLWHGDWLERFSPTAEVAVIVAWGFLCAFGLSGQRPWNAALLTLIALLLLAASAIFFQLKHHLWWNWLVPVVQAPFALVWSVGYQYTTESRRRRRLRQAFAVYLSPYMADRIANSDFDLSLGGKLTEVTVMFTDLEGFTAISESLAPEQVSRLLTTYFNQTSKPVLRRNGTITKYIGDAVMAVWGAPLEDVNQAENAVLAAWEMVQAGRQQIGGQNLRTRVGINSGRALAGNLGSDTRFDYTVIGDTTNYASRLEGFNKYLRTEILVSDSTRRQLTDQIKVRCLGKFLIPGKFEPVVIHEVLGLSATFADEGAWVNEFEKAVLSFSQGKFDQAEHLFRHVIHMRGGKDGPTEFYLKEISKARERVKPGESWGGAVVLESK